MMTFVQQVFVAMVCILLILVTIVGNVLMFLSIVLVRKLRKPQNFLLLSLAASDLVVAVFVMPLALVHELEKKWSLGAVLCDVWLSGDVLVCTASILNLCAIAVNRYQAITRPLEYTMLSTPSRIWCMVLIVWFSAATVSLPPVFFLGNKYEHESCTLSQNFWYQIYATVVSFYIPLCIIIIVYGKILSVVSQKKHRLREWGRNTGRLSTSRPDGQLKFEEKFAPVRLKDHKASATLGIIMAAFIICWFPFFLHALIRALFHLEGVIPPWVESLTLWLGYTNSALNPVIYAVLNKEFRGPYKEILFCRCASLDERMRRKYYNYMYGDSNNGSNLL